MDKTTITKDMDEVIKTSKTVRAYLGNREIPLAERKGELLTLREVINANKNIVSASIVKITVDKLADG